MDLRRPPAAGACCLFDSFSRDTLTKIVTGAPVLVSQPALAKTNAPHAALDGLRGPAPALGLARQGLDELIQLPASALRVVHVVLRREPDDPLGVDHVQGGQEFDLPGGA